MNELGSIETGGGERTSDRVSMWLLTRVNRIALAGGVSFCFFVSLLAIGVFGPTSMREVIETTDAVWWVFSPMITAIITAVALVVTFTQLVLSQELGALRDQRERMEGSIAFREDAEAWLETPVSPADPASFMAALLESIRIRGTELRDVIEDVDGVDGDGNGVGGNGRNSGVRTALNALISDADSVRVRLDGARFGTFDVVYATLDFEYSRWIYTVKRHLVTQDKRLEDDAIAAHEELNTVLELFGAAREHFKTLYFQWELVVLSRSMLYTALPALIVSLGMLLYLDPTAVSGTIVGVDTLVVLVCLAATVALAPFFILFAHILRIATVAKRTLAIGPFVLSTTR